MGWKKSAVAVRRKPVAYPASAPTAAPLRERTPARSGAASGVASRAAPGDVERTASEPALPSPEGEEPSRPRRERRALPVYDVASGEDL